MSPRVSVIVPAYNRRGVMRESVDSCLVQTFEDFEIVVVDDGSSDGTAEYVRETYGKEERVRLVVLPRNEGLACARNHGIEHARGEYVSLLDTDDLYLPRFLEAHVEALDAHGDVQMTICDVRYDGAWPRKWTTVFRRRMPPGSGADMCDGGWIVPCSVLVRTEVMRELRFEPGRRLLEDSELMFRFFEKGYRTHPLPEVLAVYRRLGEELGEVQLTADKRLVRHAALLLQEEYSHLSRDPDRHRAKLARRWTKHHLEGGERAVAARHARAWWRACPWDVRAAWTVLRTSLASSR